MITRRAFAVTDALVLVACLCVLFVLLVPLHTRARRADNADLVAGNLAEAHKALTVYSQQQADYLPPTAVLGSAPTGIAWTIAGQSDPSATFNGYVHWSGMLTALSLAQPRIFTSPVVPRGGAPAPNPGPQATDWEPGQLNVSGASAPSATPDDRQSARTPFVPNGALMPRNNLATSPGSPRFSRLVKLPQVDDPSNVVLLTEFAALSGNRPWDTVLDSSSVSKTNRPVTPFIGVSTGTNVFQEPDSATLARFTLPPLSAIRPDTQLGTDLLNDQSSTLNAIARHHPGGTSNFVMCDGSARRATVKESVQRAWWGKRFYSITGNNTLR